MRTLLVGNGTFYHVGAFFRRALADLGHPHAFVDEAAGALRPGRPFVVRAASRLSGHRAWLRRRLNARIIRAARDVRPEVVLVVGGAFMRPAALRALKAETGAVLVNFATDNPFNPLHRSRDFLDGIPLYDVYATVRRTILGDLAQAGAKRTAYVRCGYEPALHFPEPPATDVERARFGADLAFAGGADADRYPLLRAVAAEPGVTLRLYGGFWDRDELLRPSHRGFAYGRDYRLAIRGAKIALCLVRRANRDGHVMRSLEIPACGGFMLADRTDEHRELLAEDREAVYFTEPGEMQDKLRFYLKDDDARRRIAEAGRARITAGPNTWRDRLIELLDLARQAV